LHFLTESLFSLFQLYLFPFSVAGFPKSLKTESDRRVSKNLTRFFTDMAKHGNPTPASSTNHDVTIQWEPQRIRSKKFLTIGEDVKVGALDSPMKKRIEFWNRIVRDSGHLDWIPSDLAISRLFSETAEKRTSLFSHLKFSSKADISSPSSQQYSSYLSQYGNFLIYDNNTIYFYTHLLYKSFYIF